MTPHILLTGKDGQLGFALQRALGASFRVTAVGRSDCDLTDPQAVRALVARVRPDVILNPAAYTAVDKAEAEPETAAAVNAVAVGVFAEEAARSDALFFHYSTDYVFDGRKASAYSESDLPDPQSVYGKTKLSGEAMIRDAGCRHLILRTSWVFGAHGGNFLKTILRLAAERDSLRIVADQIGAPTPAALIADVTIQILRRHFPSAPNAAHGSRPLLGTYHLAAAGETTWYEYARFVVASAARMGFPLKLDADAISPISTDEYPLPAARPANSRLDTSKLETALGITLPHWQTGVTDVLNQLKTT